MNLRERLSTLYEECWQNEYDDAEFAQISKGSWMRLYMRDVSSDYPNWLRAHLKDSIVSSLFDEYVSKL